MTDIIYIAIFAVGLAIVALIVAVYFYFKARDDFNLSSPYILNFSSKDNNGRFIGREIQTEVGAYNRVLIDYKPLDIDTRKLSLKEIKAKMIPEKIITEPEKIISLAMGEISKDSAIKLILADNVDEYPESLRNTSLGKGLMWATAETNLTKNIQEIMKESNYSRDKLLKKINDGELTSEWIESMESLMKDILKMKVQDEDGRHRNLPPPNLGGSLIGNQG